MKGADSRELFLGNAQAAGVMSFISQGGLSMSHSFHLRCYGSF